MEGGVALFLLLIILVVAAIAGIALYLTGGALIFKTDREKEDAPAPRPEHEKPTSPTQENVTFAGTRQDDRVDDD
jgi:flagellar basal body-associated protein FliL